MRSKAFRSIFLVGVLGLMGTALGEPQPIDSTTNNRICTAMRGDDPTKTQQAVKEVEGLFKTNPKAAVHELSTNWAIWMWKTNKFKDLATLCRLALIAAPEQTGDVEHLVLVRGECLMYAGSSACASSAKSLYNVATLQTVPNHFDFITKALKTLKKDEPTVGEKFLESQRPGSSEKSSLSEVKIIPLYKARIARMTGEDSDTLIGRGNLLLVDDRADEAKKSFEKAVEIATDDDQKSAATEGIARAMKAQDGNCTKALAWLAEHQKKDAPTVSSK